MKVEQKDYVQEVQRLAGEYSRYIRLKLNGDDGELAEALTGYPAELDEVHCGSLEEQKKLWFEGDSIKRNPDTDQNIERGSMCEELRTGRNEKVSYPAVPEKNWCGIVENMAIIEVLQTQKGHSGTKGQSLLWN